MASRIQGITVEIGGDTTKLSSALFGVNKEIKNTQSQLKDVEKLLKLDPTNTELLAQKQRLLGDAIKETKDKLDTLKTAASQANEQLQKGDITKEQYDGLQREIQETEQKLKSLEEQAAKTNTTLLKIDEVGGKLKDVGDKVSGVGKALMPVSAGVTALGTAAVKMTSDFDSGMSRVAAISGATDEELAKLRQTAKDLGASTAFSASEAAAGMENLASAGFEVNEIIEAMPGMLDLAASSGEDLASSADIAASTLRGFGMDASEAGHVADVLAQNAAATNAAVADTGEAMKYIAPLANTVGLEFEEVAASIGIMANAGIKGSQAGTTLRGALSRLAKPTDPMIAKMEELGLSFYNADGQMKSLSEMVSMLQTNMEGLTDEQKQNALVTLFGQEALSGMMVLMEAGPEQIDALTDSYRNCDGAAASMAQTMMDNLGGDMEELGGSIETLAISVGEIMVPVIREIVAKLQEFMDKLNALDPATKELIVKIGLVVAALGPFLLILGKIISVAGSAMQGFVKLAQGARLLVTNISGASGIFGKLGAALGGISAPVMAVVAVIGTLTAAFMTLWNTNEGFRAAITEIWNGIVATVQGFCQEIVEKVNSLGFDFQNITEMLKAIWNGFCSLLAPVFTGAFQLIADTLRVVLNTISGILSVFIGIFTGDWQGAWEGVKQIFVGIWEFIKNTFINILNTLKGVADAFLGLFGTDWNTVWTAIKDFFIGIWNSISSFFSGVLSGIQSAATTVWNAVSGFFTTVLTGIQTTFTTVWNAIKTAVTTVMTAIQTTVSTVWNAISTAVSTVLNTIKTVVLTVWNAIKTAITTVMTAIQTTITTVWNAIYTTIEPLLTAFKYLFETIWQAIQILIGNAMTAIQTTVTNVWNAIVASSRHCFRAFRQQ